MSSSFGSWDTEPPEIIELDLSGATPKPADVLRDAPRVRLLLDPDADDSDDNDSPPPGPGEYRSGLLVVLAYTLGPFAPVFMRQGKHNTAWTLVALLSISSWAALVWRWPEVRLMLEQGIAPFLPWSLTMYSMALLWAAAWCRAIFLAGVDRRFVPERLPRWLRAPAAMAAGGLLAPGLGHLASGHPRRAAVAFWMVATSALPILTLSWSGWLWQCNENAGVSGVPGLALETMFVASAALVGLGTLLWIGSALDGVRLHSVRAHGRSEIRGDWLAATLLVVIVLLLFTLRPVQLAGQLDQFAGAMRHAGYRLTPLCLEATASQLDPAKPKYAMQMAELFESLGKKQAAQQLRNGLRERWDTYAEQLLREELHDGEELVPLPIDVVAESADSTAAEAAKTP